MILIVTHKTDFTADFVIEKLNLEKISYYRLNCEDILQKNNITISIDENFVTKISNIERFDSIWFRRTKLPNLEKYESIKNYCYEEIDSFFSNLWHSINAKRWLSIPEKVYSAENKLLQLKTAQNLGFNIPNTIISGNSEVIKNFFYSTNKNVIIKPLFNSRFIENDHQSLIFTNILKESDLTDLENRLPIPSIYQENISKKFEYRVTVVNNSIFIAKVDSQSSEATKTDWRRGKLKFTSADIPNKIKNLCISLVHKLNLTFGAIDLIEDHLGQFYFLEINPNGQWAWIEIDTDLPISKSIINYLTESDEK